MSDSPPLQSRHQLLGQVDVRISGRDRIHDFFDGMNARTGMSARRLGAMPIRAVDELVVTSLAMPEQARAGGATFMVEAQFPMALDVQTLDAASAPNAYSVCVPLSGEFRLHMRSGTYAVQAGQALLIDPTQVELTQVSAGTHFIEFNVPKADLVSLGAELTPGGLGSATEFNPVVRGVLVEKLKTLALQAAACLQPGASAAAREFMFRRWSELLTLTLLDEHIQLEQRIGRGGARPPALKRALDFIAAHAHEELLIADIANAACVSARSLLRMFHEHLEQSPGAYLRHTRLDLARSALRNGTATSIQDLAQQSGFQNAGKFSQAYKRRFGESPSETRSLPR